MDNAYMGMILPWAMDFAPQNWALCNGQLLPVANFAALFSLLGTKYGGDGIRNFALPDLRSRVPIGMGDGTNGFSVRTLGQTYGAEGAALTANNLPAHTHTLTASNTDSGLSQAPAPGWTLGAAASNTGGRQPVTTPVQMYGGANPSGAVQSAPTSVAGSASPAPVPTIPPAACINFIICTQGIYPTRP
jgi:microcystin-dependent protein